MSSIKDEDVGPVFYEDEELVQLKISKLPPGSEILNCNLDRTFFHVPKLKQVIITHCEGLKTRFCDMEIYALEMSSCQIGQGMFQNISWSEGSITASTLDDCDFEKVTLWGVALNNTSFIYSGFSDAKLLLNESVTHCDFTGCDFTNTIFLVESGALIKSNKFVSIEAQGASFNKGLYMVCDFSLAEFLDAKFTGVTFLRCIFHNANFRNAVLENTRFWKCDLKGASFGGLIPIHIGDHFDISVAVWSSILGGLVVQWDLKSYQGPTAFDSLRGDFSGEDTHEALFYYLETLWEEFKRYAEP